jgi:hypothetical protein
LGLIVRKIVVDSRSEKRKIVSETKLKHKGSSDRLSRKCKALKSNPSTTKRK